jgi:hypothetical protein
MKNHLLIAFCILAVSMSAGCASATSRSARPSWNSAEIVGIVSSHPDVRRDWFVRSIDAAGPETIVVWLADVGDRSNERQRVILRLQHDGTWHVTKVDYFTI